MMTVRAGCFTLRTKHYVCSNRCVPVGTTSAAGTSGKMIAPSQLLNFLLVSLFLIARCPVQEARHQMEVSRPYGIERGCQNRCRLRSLSLDCDNRRSGPGAVAGDCSAIAKHSLAFRRDICRRDICPWARIKRGQ